MRATISAAPDLDALLNCFARDGFTCVERVMTAGQVAAAKRGVEWAMTHAGGPYKWIKQRTYEWYDHPVFVELLEHALVMGFARGWLGEGFHLIGAQCSRNTQADQYAPGVLKLHHDAVLFPKPERKTPGVPEERYGFSAMWYLQDTPLEMGPTELLPGSHRSGRVAGDPEPAPETLWRRAIPAGSLLLFNHRTWHRGALNQTDTPRDLVTNAYGRPETGKVQVPTKLPDGREGFFPPPELLAACSDTLRMLLREP